MVPSLTMKIVTANGVDETSTECYDELRIACSKNQGRDHDAVVPLWFPMLNGNLNAFVI
jgi:hypothetical protein